MSARLRAPRRALTVLGIVGAVALAVNVNLLAARFFRRWDFTQDALYTLSEPTRRTLAALDSPIDVVVLLNRSDPLATSVRHLLKAYRSETAMLRVKELDPEQNPAEFSAIQRKYDIAAGMTAEGQAYTDASVIVARGERHWFVTADDLMRLDAEGDHVRPALEQALTESIANVLVEGKLTICFSRGHQERGLYDAGPEGLAEFRARIEKNNYVVEERDLGVARVTANLSGCRVLVLGGPRLPFAEGDAKAIARAVEAGTSLFALIPPMLGADGKLRSSGLEPVFELADAELGSNLVLETDSARRAPRGHGEVFSASPLPHAVTRGLTRGEARSQFDVMVSEAQSVRPRGAAVPLLVTSEQAVALDDLRPLLEGRDPGAAASEEKGKFVLAVARERETKPDSPPVRLVLAGSAVLAENRSFRDAALYGDRLFVENALAWLSARPALVSVPEKNPRELGLSLSEESLSEVLRYVLLYMPATAALLGAFVILRRRSLETRSRRPKPGENADAPRA